MRYSKTVTLLLFVVLTTVLISCKKEDKTVVEIVTEFPYEQRLEGDWKLQAVEYDTEIPDITGSGSSTQISGSGVSVNGNLSFERNPNLMDYNFSFIAMVDITGSGFPLPIPINFGGSGDWTTTSDKSKLILRDGGTEFIFDVVVNDVEKQIFETTISENFQGFLTLEVNIVLTFVKGN